MWNQVIVRVLDIRVQRIGRGDDIRDYAAPTSLFVFAANGQAELQVDGSVWLSDRFHLLHIGKGKRITVRPFGPLDVYMVLYKAALPAVALREFHMMMQNDNPFSECWGITPSDPLALLEMLGGMLDGWRGGDKGETDGNGEWALDDRRDKDHNDGLKRLQAKGEFIRFAHAALRERAERAHTPSLSEQVARYMAQNYRGTISVERLAQQLNYSPQYVSRKFKEQMGCSPLDYAIRLRMDEARRLLLTTEATLQEVAAYVGYPDMMYFNRMFKKHAAMTPGQYRKKYRGHVSKNATNRINSSVVALHTAMYHVISNDTHYQQLPDGGNRMASGKKNLAAIALLCLSMLASACGAAPDGATAGGSGATGAATNANAAGGETEAASAAETRTVTTVFGDVEAPAHPQRVAAPAYLGTVLALGVQPVASETFLMQSPYLTGMLDGVEDVADSLEKLLELEPELIITQIAKEETVEKYAQIAPTVAMPYNSFASIQEEMRYFGELLDKTDVAEQWIADFESRAGQLRERVTAALGEGETVSIMQEYDGTVFLFGPKSGRGGRIMYEILGAKPPAAIPESMLAESYSEFSLEKLPEFTGDYLILTTESTLEEFQKDPIWGNLPAIRDGKVFLWTENQSWYRDPIAVDGQINALAEWIIAAAGK